MPDPPRSHLVPGPIQERSQLVRQVETLRSEVDYLTARISALERYLSDRSWPGRYHRASTWGRRCLRRLLGKDSV